MSVASHWTVVSVNPRWRHGLPCHAWFDADSREKIQAVGLFGSATWQLAVPMRADAVASVLAHGDGRASFGGLVCTCTYDCTLQQACMQTMMAGS